MKATVLWFNPGKHYGELKAESGEVIFLNGDVIEPGNHYGPLPSDKMPKSGDLYLVQETGKARLFSDTEKKLFAKKVRRLKKVGNL